MGDQDDALVEEWNVGAAGHEAFLQLDVGDSEYSAEFRSDAIALWRASAGGRTFRDVAADL
ncbi:hypothetical protein, partial [Streptomyces chryseus]